MKKWTFYIALTAFLCLTLADFVAGQTVFSPALQQKIKQDKREKEWFTVVVLGTEKANLDSLKQHFYNNATPRHQRAVIVLKSLQDAAKQQMEILQALQQFPYEKERSYWITNMVLVKAPASTLQQLAQSGNVARIELENENLVKWHEPVSVGNSSVSRVNNGVEPGVEAIGTRFLWNLGYTGKGTKVLSFDTGLWPNHPAFRNRFMGKRAPIDQAWFGYDKKRPGDKTSHGTHTNSTCMGLDTSLNDTMGIAYNAYFMATDPIVYITADIKSYAEMAIGYEWAMNPDGNIQTTHDMPDVINNSWGREHQAAFDTIVCDGFYEDILLAVELAGIVSVQSAGNEGPGSGTVGSPANMNSTLVNNFSVGAVNGNDTAFPIASFSSRGPSQCGDTGSALIKPEVVAPGVNVLGAIRENDGTYDYGYYSGTSMAGPHAAGMSLLLREAFPQATAEEIKMAMYLSADDLGDVGEDNTYGNGMINAEGAYTYLSQFYTPLVPSNTGFDLAIEWSNMDDIGMTCASTFEPKIKVITPSSLDWNDVAIVYGFEGETPQTMTFSNPVSDTLTLNSIMAATGTFKSFYAQLMYTGSAVEDDTINNKWYSYFNIQEGVTLPYAEDFEGVNLYRSEWYVQDDENDMAFDTSSTGGLSNSAHSAYIRLGRYGTRDGQRDGLITPLITTPTSGRFELFFDVAYSSVFDGFNDSLLVKVSTDCGATWQMTSYAKGPNELKTDPLDLGVDWTPDQTDQWRRDTVDLSAFVNAGEVLIKFETYNQKGGNIFIDNVNIYDNNGPLAVKEKAISFEYTLAPNPAEGYVQLLGNSSASVNTVEVSVYTVTGQFVLQKQISVNDVITTQNWSSGVYFLQINNGENVETQKLVVRH